MITLKKEFLELLDKDLEFRYAVAGYLGLSETMKKLDIIVEEQVKLREEQVKLSEEQVRLREEQKRLAEEQKRLAEEQVRLRSDFNRMLERVEAIEVRLGRIERTLEKLTIDLEDEARSFVGHRLREMGLSLDLSSLTLPDLEVNIYGVSDDVCVIGEAAVRAGAGLAGELLRNLKRLRRDHPEKLRRRIIPLLYVCLPTFELIEEAKEKGIWLLKATEEFHRPEKLFMET